MIKLALTILLFLTSATFSQNEPVLFDEFGRIYCDHLLARIDGFRHELALNPTSTGHVVIFGQRDSMRANVFYEEMIRSYFKTRKFDLNRITFVRGNLGTDLNIQLWIVPSGESVSEIPAAKWSYEFSEDQKPYKFTWENNYDDICPEVDGLKLYADFLDQNPSARGNIVIRQTTTKQLRRKTAQVIAELTKKYGIPRSRLNVFQVRATPDGINQSVEYWLVP